MLGSWRPERPSPQFLVIGRGAIRISDRSDLIRPIRLNPYNFSRCRTGREGRAARDAYRFATRIGYRLPNFSIASAAACWRIVASTSDTASVPPPRSVRRAGIPMGDRSSSIDVITSAPMYDPRAEG